MEIGTFIGVSTRFLLEVSKKYDTSIDCVDPCIKHRSFTSILETRIRIISKQYEARVNHLIGFWSDQPVKGFEEYSIYNPINIDKKYDFVFIDGDHTYESVKRDFELAKQCLTSQGVIAFHDIYSWEGVAQFVKEAPVTKCGLRLNDFLRKFGRNTDGIGYFTLTP